MRHPSLLFFVFISLLFLGCIRTEGVCVPECGGDSVCLGTECVLKSGCDYSNPSCGQTTECVNNACVLRRGCEYGNPACAWNEDCTNNSCALKSGCSHNNPPCASNENCINNSCALKTGCQYNNPLCGEMQDCIGNSCISRCAYPSSSWPYPPERPMLGTRKVLLVLSDPQRPDHPAPSRASVEKLIFGPDPSVSGYYLENSQEKFTIEKAGVFGWYTTNYPVYGDDLEDSDHDGFLHYDQARWVEALRRVDREFNFAAYDTDRNGVLEVDELAIHFLTPESNEVPGGALRGISSQETPTWEPLVLDGVRIDAVSDAGTGTPLSVGASAHEISHLILGSPDMYFNFFLPYAAGAYSVMDQHGYSPHFDPYHKMEYGWVTPKVISEDGCYLLDKVDSSGEVLLYYDPHRGKGEYFLFENRQIGEYYDSRLPDTGLGVWQIITDPDVYGNLPPPKFVPRSDWETVWEGDFGHRGIRQIRPVYGPPFDDSTALWDSSNLADGPAEFYWADGTLAFTLTSISSSREQMYFEIKLAD